jgi:pimeloyl-ACP methyl ester carboxylesterase
MTVPAEGSVPRLLLFTGMNRRAEIFRRQVSAFPGIQVVAWRKPRTRETLGAYAQRLADDLAQPGPCFIGGCSFGGVVALEVGCRLDARACFLISSVRSPRELPPWMRICRAAPRLAGQLPWIGASPSIRGLATKPDHAWHAWAVGALLGWKPDPRIATLRVRAIHGTNDRTFPRSHVHPDVVVPGGGHVLCVTHADAVNAFLRAEMDTSP